MSEKAAYNEVECGLCKGVAHELRRGINRVNKHTQNLDLRGRVDSRGQRSGKVLDYKMSETRVLEVLDGEDGNTPLCKNFDDWSVVIL